MQTKHNLRKPMYTPREEWKKEFDKRFSVFDGWQKVIKHFTYSKWIKDFIRQTLASITAKGVDKERKRIKKRIKELEILCNQYDPECFGGSCIYRFAIDELESFTHQENKL